MLHWLAQASSVSELTALYDIGKSTVATIVHEGITIHHENRDLFCNYLLFKMASSSIYVVQLTCTNTNETDKKYRTCSGI